MLNASIIRHSRTIRVLLCPIFFALFSAPLHAACTPQPAPRGDREIFQPPSATAARLDGAPNERRHAAVAGGLEIAGGLLVLALAASLAFLFRRNRQLLAARSRDIAQRNQLEGDAAPG